MPPCSGPCKEHPINPLLESNGLPKFSVILPEHVEPAILEVIESNRTRLDELLKRAEESELNFETGILPLEDLADRLHRVWAPICHLHAVANNPELRAAYSRCLPIVAGYQTDIAQDERLFRLYKRVADTLPAERSDGPASVGVFCGEASATLAKLPRSGDHYFGILTNSATGKLLNCRSQFFSNRVFYGVAPVQDDLRKDAPFHTAC